jgi:hypothetical protein
LCGESEGSSFVQSLVVDFAAPLVRNVEFWIVEASSWRAVLFKMKNEKAGGIHRLWVMKALSSHCMLTTSFRSVIALILDLGD